MLREGFVTILNMTSTGHALIGALLAAKFNNPYLAIGFSFLSHYPSDILPHWDVGTHLGKKTSRRRLMEGSIDIGIGLILSIILYSYLSLENNYFLLLLCIFSAQLPDWISAPVTVFKMNISVIKRLDNFSDQFHNKLDKPWGIVTQVGVLILLYIVLFIVF